MRKILRQPLLNAAVAACGVIDKSDPPPERDGVRSGGSAQKTDSRAMIKQLIKFSLNHIPRPVLQRIAGWAVPVAGLFYKYSRRGGVEFPVCGAKYRKFLPYGYVQPRPNALCPKCLSLERHRLLWL